MDVSEKQAMAADEIQAMAAEMTRRGLTIATAEADTAGYMGHLLCAPSGASRYFLGGIIAYAGDAKSRVLGVDPDIHPERGAVSREMALAMARQARTLFGADLGVSATGVAGPTGGSAEKPPGTFWVALSAGDGGETVVEHRWGSADRLANKERAAHAALRLVKEHLGLSPL